jgi:hypothetical protein
VERDYDLFEALSDGRRIWREMVLGHENAIPKLLEKSKRTLPFNLLAPSLAFFLLVSQRSRLDPRNMDRGPSARIRDAVAPRHRHTSWAQQAHWTRRQELRYLAFRFWHFLA